MNARNKSMEATGAARSVSGVERDWLLRDFVARVRAKLGR